MHIRPARSNDGTGCHAVGAGPGLSAQNDLSLQARMRMSDRLATTVGSVRLKNPLIAAAA
jgi:hypothetical protein